MFTWKYRLRAGHTGNPAQGACAMDAVNWLVHGVHGDKPQCACPEISRFVIYANDMMDDNTRQGLLAYLHRIAGSRSQEHVEARERVMWMAAVRVFLSMAMREAGLDNHAEWLSSLSDDLTTEDAVDAIAVCKKALEALPVEALPVEALWAIQAAKEAKNAVENYACSTVSVAQYTIDASTSKDAALKVWSAYFQTLNDVLNAGPQGEPWSADVVEQGMSNYRQAKGLVCPA